MLQIYNSLSRKKEPFRSQQEGVIKMYVCGMTVYDYCHLGHARMLVSFDMIQRWFKAQGYAVHYVRNITDIDDKIIQKALNTKQSLSEVTAYYIQAMHEDEAALNVERPTEEPRATQFIPQMLEIIDALVAKDLAYPAENGDVNFAVRTFPEYGKLSGQDLDAMQSGNRVQADHDKRDPLDFVLWKSAKEHEPADTRWQSPYGWGRPGWHIECSAMSRSLLGMPLDIHGGGPDLKFPHHENEIAQSEGAFGLPLAHWWMHCGSLMVDSEKMSKSLGNFFTIRDILKEYPAEVVRYFILKSHYRSAQNFSKDTLQEAKAALTRLYNALLHVPPKKVLIDWSQEPCKTFAAAMNDDFNTPEAMAVLFELATQVNKHQCADSAGLLVALGGVLGLLQQNPQDFLQGEESAEIDYLIAQRNQAKKDKNFALSDKIRNDLLAQGIILEDQPGGKTIWRRQ